MQISFCKVGVVCSGLDWAWQPIVKRNGNQIEKLIEMPRNGANNNGQVMRMSTAHTQQEEEEGGREYWARESWEGKVEAGNEFSNLSIGLVAFVCVIMAKAKDKLEIYCYYGRKEEEQ